MNRRSPSGPVPPSQIGKLSLLLFVLGLLGLFIGPRLHSIGLFFSLDFNPPKWVEEILHHISTIVAGTGLVALVFEKLLRDSMAQDFVARMAVVFDQDADFANVLNPAQHQQRVSATLNAHLGEDLGTAIYNGLVERYLGGNITYRREFHYDATLAELDNDVVVGTTTLSKEDYYRLTMSQDFYQHERQPSPLVTLQFLWQADIEALNLLFQDADCLFREALCFRPDDATGIDQDLSLWAGDPDTVARSLASLVSISSFSVGETILQPKGPPSIVKGGVVFEYSTKGIPAEAEHIWRLTVSTLFAKKRAYPVVLGEPTNRAVVSFTYPDSAGQVLAFPFFTSARPFAPTIQRHNKTIVVITNHWVFPSSGVLFTSSS